MLSRKALTQQASYENLQHQAQSPPQPPLAGEDYQAACLRGQEALRTVIGELPCWDRIVPALLEGGLSGLPAKCGLTPGIPYLLP